MKHRTGRNTHLIGAHCKDRSNMAAISEIANYFTECSIDYRRFWTDGKNLAMHYGYWDSETSELQDAISNMNKVLCRKASIRPGEAVLDAGCGLGGSAIWIAEHIGARVVGVNVCEKDLQTAARSAKERKVDQLAEFRYGDMRATGLAAASFDVVWAVESIVHTDDKAVFFHEAHRLLKEGGRLIIADGFLGKERFAFSKHQTAALNTIEKGWAISIAMPDEYLQAIGKAGFRNIEFKDITPNIMRTSRHIYVRGILLHPVALLLRALRVRTWRGLYNCAACTAQYTMFAQGCWRYGIIYAQK